MTTKHLAILCAVVLGTLSFIYLLPKQLGYQPVGVVMQLPEYVGTWFGRTARVTEKEMEVLGPDTDFARKNYFSSQGDQLYASIVLSGQDMMTGIHRPERCLQAQGWTTGDSSVRTVEVPGFGPLQATRLQTKRKQVLATPSGQPERVVDIQSVSYYWFIGYTGVSGSHERRVFMDFRDRVLGGYNQRWAMVMLTSEITENSQRFGRNEEQTDEMMVKFIQKLAPTIIGKSVNRTASAEKAGGQLVVAVQP